MGLVNRVVPPESLRETVQDLADKIAKNSVLALKLSKSALNRGIGRDIEQALDGEAIDAVLCAHGAGSAERAGIALRDVRENPERRTAIAPKSKRPGQ